MTGFGILNVIAAVVVPGLYVCSVVRIIKSRAADRAVACAGMMLIVFFVLMAALSVPNIASWMSLSLGFLILLLGLSTLFFLLKRAADGLGRKRVVRLKGFSLFQLGVRPMLENPPNEEEYVLGSEGQTSAESSPKWSNRRKEIVPLGLELAGQHQTRSSIGADEIPSE
jgi:hypothetical protein